MLQVGEDAKFIARRMVVFASEDVGLAAPAALNLAVSTFLAVERIGLPEAEINLSHCAVVLAKSPKSRESYDAWGEAKAAATQYPDLPVPPGPVSYTPLTPPSTELVEVSVAAGLFKKKKL